MNGNQVRRTARRRQHTAVVGVWHVLAHLELARYRVDGLSGSQGLMPILSEHTWRWPDGSTREGRSSGRSGLADMMSRLALNGEGQQVTAGQTAADTLVFSSYLPALTMGKVRAEPTAYVMPARFRLMRFELKPRMVSVPPDEP